MWENDDDLLLEELRKAKREADAVPPAFLEAAKAAYSWRTVDEELELLTLSFDSSLAKAVGNRGPGATSERVLVFESEDVTMTLEVGPHTLMGQVVPARSDRVTLEVATGVVDESEADESGFFLLRRPEAGPVRLKWHGTEVPVVTEWVAI